MPAVDGIDHMRHRLCDVSEILDKQNEIAIGPIGEFIQALPLHHRSESSPCGAFRFASRAQYRIYAQSTLFRFRGVPQLTTLRGTTRDTSDLSKAVANLHVSTLALYTALTAPLALDC